MEDERSKKDLPEGVAEEQVKEIEKGTYLTEKKEWDNGKIQEKYSQEWMPQIQEAIEKGVRQVDLKVVSRIDTERTGFIPPAIEAIRDSGIEYLDMLGFDVSPYTQFVEERNSTFFYLFLRVDLE
jgi:hypothetical protein